MQQQQAAQAGPSRYAQQAPAYGGTPRNQSSSNGSQPAIGSPQEIENSRNTARKHYIELSAYLNGKDLSGKLLNEAYRPQIDFVMQSHEAARERS